MKLAVVTNILTPYRIPLFEALEKRTGSLHVLLMAEREENRQWTLGAGAFRHEVLPGLHVRLPGSEVSLHLNYGVTRALRRADPDVVLSGGYAAANVAAWGYCRLRKRPFVGWGELTMRDVGTTSPPRQIVRRLLTRGSAGSIASSSDARDVFVHYGAPPSTVLTAVMPIEVERYHAAATLRGSPWAERERARFGGPILLAVGRMAAGKGYAELLAIYDLVVKQCPTAALLIAGDGPERAMHEARARSRGWPHVHFLGYRDPDAIVRLLALADLFVFPTLLDRFGAVLSEAMAAELPVISSIHASATGDLVEDGVTGFRIDPLDAAASAQTILHVLRMSPGERAAMGRAAYARVQRHGIDATAESMMSFLASLIGEGAREGRRPT